MEGSGNSDTTAVLLPVQSAISDGSVKVIFPFILLYAAVLISVLVVM